MTIQLVPLVITALLGSMVAVSDMQGAGRQATAEPPEAGQPQTPEEIEEEKAVVLVPNLKDCSSK